MKISTILKEILSSDYINIYDAAQTISSQTGETVKSIHNRLSKWIAKEPESWVLVNRTLNQLGYKLELKKMSKEIKKGDRIHVSRESGDFEITVDTITPARNGGNALRWSK
jgi:hypothetical protein